jgi:hypothetical protein
VVPPSRQHLRGQHDAEIAELVAEAAKRKATFASVTQSAGSKSPEQSLSELVTSATATVCLSCMLHVPALGGGPSNNSVIHECFHQWFLGECFDTSVRFRHQLPTDISRQPLLSLSARSGPHDEGYHLMVLSGSDTFGLYFLLVRSGGDGPRGSLRVRFWSASVAVGFCAPCRQ